MTEPASRSPRLCVTDRFSWEPLPDGCMLYEEATGELITLNGPAELILSHCDGGHSLEGLCGLMESEFDLPPATTRDLIGQLMGAGVIADQAGT